jgi:plasmid stability protein
MSLNLSIKGVSEPVAERLRARAERNHRSLQGELMAIIERAAAEDLPTAAQPFNAAPQARLGQNGPGARRPLASLRQGFASVADIAAEHLARYPKPFRDGPRSVDIIRQDRDSR